MSKKKQPRNAFYFFMLDFKARGERNNEVYPNGLRDVQEDAGREWSVMPGPARKKYEDMAKEEKERLKYETKKSTCRNNLLDDIELQRRNEELAKQKMFSYIRSTLVNLAKNQRLATFKFYLVHANYFCISLGDCYHPAELALAEFSLEEGVTNVYHTIIDPGDVQLGFRREAEIKSSESHMIPLDANGGEKDFDKIFNAVEAFIEPGKGANGEFPPLYTMPDNVNLNTSITGVKNILASLRGNVAGAAALDDSPFLVYPIEVLFLELQNACCKVAGEADQCITSLGLGLAEMEKDVFNFTRHISCKFHQDEDRVEFCSKSYVQRWVYLICDHCCQFLKIELECGKHLPQNADTSAQQKLEERNLQKQKEQPRSDAIAPRQSSWVPVEQPPLPRPQRVPTELLPATEGCVPDDRDDKYEPYYAPNEEIRSLNINDFPALDAVPVIVRGRGRGFAGRGYGFGPMNFASAAKKK